MRATTGSESRHRLVVIGGGMAGARLAQQLAAVPEAELTVIGEEPHPPYNRVLLAEVLAGRYAPEVIALPEPAGHRLGGVRAVRIDRGARTVHCDDGRLVGYDTLVLATGSNPVLPPLRGLFPPGGTPADEGGGALPEGVRPFRTMDDCLALAAAARPGVRAVVIGGGLLGVSAARALAGRGAQVVLAHQGEHLMERHLDAQAAGMLHGYLTSLGIEVHTECRVRGLRVEPYERTATAGGRAVRAVELADGFALDADLVVLACGVRPRVGLARAAGIATGRGIVVDDQLRTSDPRVYAIGDCAEHRGVLYGLAGPAQEQADLLGRVLADRVRAVAAGTRYTGTRALTRLTLAAPATGGHRGSAPAASEPPGPTPFDLAAFGEPVPAPGDDVVHLSDATRNAYRKVVVRGDRLVGGILLGDLGTVGALARTWEGDEPLPSAPLLHLLTDDGGS
ncbi:nitrite reductase [Streptomyces albus subsp. albus]|nr:nitrite reductase [Streptomyces albus subsp. albus]